MLAALLLLVVGAEGCFDSCGGQTDIISPNDMDEGYFLTRNCFCDAECTKYGDCCLDKALQEGTTPTEPWVCNSLASKTVKWDVYMIGACPPEWSDELVDKRCRRDVDQARYTFVMDVPVISRLTNWTYVNAFCAHCHNDTISLVATTLNVTCPHFLPDCRKTLENPTYTALRRLWQLHDGVASFTVTEQDDSQRLAAEHGLRRCRQVLDKCNKTEESEATASCLLYSNYTYLWGDNDIIYKNPCFACLGEASVLHCNLTAAPSPVNTLTSEYSGAYFALLLDFNEMHGEWVGTTDFLKEGKISSHAGSQNLSEATNASLMLSCEVMAFYPPNFSIIPNGSLHLHLSNVAGALYNWSMVVDERDYVLEGNESNASYVWVCVEEDFDFSSRFSIFQNRLSVVCLSLSVTCLVAHVVIYSKVPKLHNLPGRNLVSLAGCLLVAQVLFLGVYQVPYVRLCEVMAVVMHYTSLAAFFWINVMSIDICRVFTSSYYQNDSVGQAKNYRRYSRFAWLWSTVIVAIALLLDHSSLYPSLSPKYGKGFCWITRRYALLVFFALPMALLLLVSIIYFGLTAHSIYRTVQSTQVARRSSDRIRFYLYLKLAILMGLGWSLGFAAAFTDSEPLWLVCIFLNASQGVFILVAFSLKRKILQFVCERMFCTLRKQIRRSLQLAATSATNLTVAVTKISSSTPQLGQD